jgi:hypothetical protein
MSQETFNSDEFDKQVHDLREAAARTIDPCLVAQYIALSDAEVRAHIKTKHDAGYVFAGMSCFEASSVSEQRYVYFDYRCRPGVFCFVKPAFAAVVDLVKGSVVRVIDPYLGAISNSGAIGGTHGQSTAAGVGSLPNHAQPNHLTTLIVGEEHPTTLVLGEEHPTTLVLGEENPWTDPRVDDPALSVRSPFGGF